MKKFFITFGQDHPLKNDLCIIVADNRDAARDGAERFFCRKWDKMYDYSKLEKEQDKFEQWPIDMVIIVDEWGSIYTENLEEFLCRTE